MQKAIRIAFFALLALASGRASAEVLTDGRAIKRDSAMDKYLNSPAAVRLMYEGAVFVDRSLGIVCDGEYRIQPIVLIVVEPVNLPEGAKEATAGAWINRFDVTRCGKTKRNNLISIAQPNAEPKRRMLPPGESIASPILMMDAMAPIKLQASRSLDKDCREANVYDIGVTKMPHSVTEGGKTLNGVWQENWTIQGCGKMVSVPVTFIPDGRGGTTFAVGK